MEPGNLIFLYWFENIIVAFFTIWKIVLLKDNSDTSASVFSETKDLIILKHSGLVNFLLYYGIFTLSHGLIVFSVMGTRLIFNTSLLFGILSIFFSHGMSFLTNYIYLKKYLKTSLGYW